MIDDRLDEIDPRGYTVDEVRDLDEYYDRVVLGGNVTVRTRIDENLGRQSGVSLSGFSAFFFGK